MKYNNIIKFNFIFLVSISFVLISCIKEKSAKIRIQNNVHNTILTSINYGEYPIYGDLIPGATSNSITITDDKDNWPKTNVIEFYMQANNKLVYLKTKNSFELNPDDDLTITVWDSTEVANPLLTR